MFSEVGMGWTPDALLFLYFFPHPILYIPVIFIKFLPLIIPINFAV